MSAHSRPSQHQGSRAARGHRGLQGKEQTGRSGVCREAPSPCPHGACCTSDWLAWLLSEGEIQTETQGLSQERRRHASPVPAPRATARALSRRQRYHLSSQAVHLHLCLMASSFPCLSRAALLLPSPLHPLVLAVPRSRHCQNPQNRISALLLTSRSCNRKIAIRR